MYDQHKAQLERALQDIDKAVTTMEEIVESRTVFLSNATRLAVLEEQLQLARQRLANANYDLAQTDGYGHAPNFFPRDIVKLDDDIGHLERLVTTARFAVKHEK